MGNIIAFPSAPTGERGVIHVWRCRSGGYEIGQESASGNSWGSFETFDTAQAAIEGAYRLNRDLYSGVCEVFISPDVLGDGGAAA